MSGTPRHGTPIKMIWMFITLTVALGCLGLLMSARADFRIVSNALEAAVPMILLSVAAYVCLIRGALNLALPGAACLCATLLALLFRSTEMLYPAIIVAIMIGALLGVLTGLFSIQSRHKVLLVTAIASLVFGSLFYSLTLVVSDGMSITLNARDRVAITVFCWAGFILAAGAAILGSLGRHALPVNDADEPHVRGGTRFLWTVIAGMLAGLAGAVMLVRNHASNPSLFSSYNELTILPILLLAGVLIPNVRRSTGEAIFGGVSVLLAGLAVGFLSMYFNYWGLSPYVQRIVYAVLSLLLLIPNLAICRRGRGPAKSAESSFNP